MINIMYTDHLKLRLRVRKIPFRFPKIIYEEPDQTFFDNVERTYVAIKKLRYGTTFKNFMIAYERHNENIYIITIHPITEEKIINRVLSGRWSKNGK